MPVIIHWSETKTKQEDCFKIQTPVGILNVYQIDNVITKTEWSLGSSEKLTVVNELCKQILSYLNNPTNILKVNLQKQGSDYRKKVWTRINNIPQGKVLSYSDLARQIDSGARAVANACRENPFPAIIPCHRVVAKAGLGGYMGETSGKALEIKKKLLAIESAMK